MHVAADNLKIRRAWAMPSGETFSIAPIAALVRRWLAGCQVIVDPFARNSPFGTITNDLNPETSAQHHMEATAFLDMLIDQGVYADAGIMDPPYSPRQIRDCYQGIGRTVTQADTQHAKLVADAKDRLARLIKHGGIAITCGWNSGGMGVNRGFEMIELLTVCHGGSHNDTIVVVERKRIPEADLFGA
jgi:hypothetical protein